MFEAILLILFTILFAFIAWWKLDWALVLAIIFSPAYLIRFELFGVPMTVLEIMVLVLFLVWLIKTFMAPGSWADRCRSIQWPWKWLTLIFVLVGIVAVLISPDIRQALGLWKAYILEPVLFFMVFVNVVKTKQQLYSVIWALGSLIVLVGYMAMLQYLGIMDIPGDYGLESPMRATSFFPFPTAVGKLIGPLVAMFLGMILMRENYNFKPFFEFIKTHLFHIGIIVFGGMGLLFSFSRGAIIGILVSLVFISIFSKWRKWIWATLGILIVLALLISPIRQNIMGVFYADDVSTDVRLVMWKGAVRIIEDNPVTGTGLASFPVVYDDYKEASHTEYFPNPDHFILSVWIELGLAGLVIFGWLIIRFFREAKKLFMYNKSLAVGLMSFMVALLAYGFLDTPYFKNDLAIVFWTVFSLVIVANRLHKPQNVI